MTKSRYAAEYDTRMLYEQKCTTEEGYTILTSMHACLWTYQQAVGATTARIRLTCIYEECPIDINPVSGAIEQWRSEGWSIIDEFCDTSHVFLTGEDFRNQLLEMTRAFLLGVPLGAKVAGSVPSSVPSGSKPKKPFKKFTRKNTPQVTSEKVPPLDGIKAENEKDIAKDTDIDIPKNDDDDDDDWL